MKCPFDLSNVAFGQSRGSDLRTASATRHPNSLKRELISELSRDARLDGNRLTTSVIAIALLQGEQLSMVHPPRATSQKAYNYIHCVNPYFLELKSMREDSLG